MMYTSQPIQKKDDTFKNNEPRRRLPEIKVGRLLAPHTNLEYISQQKSTVQCIYLSHNQSGNKSS